MNLTELQKTIHAINVEKGWHDEPLRVDGKAHTIRVLAKLDLVHSELCEAEDEYANDTLDVYFNDAKPMKPEGYVVELADAVIRAMDICESLGLQMTTGEALQRKGATLHSYVAAATEAARDGDYTRGFVRALSGLLHACDLICESKRLDLYAAIELKIDYNRTRPHMHGGRLA